MGVAETLDVVGQQRRQFAIGKRAVTFARDPSPRTQVHLIDRHRFVETIALLAAGEPLLIRPIVLQVPNDRCALGRDLVE